MVQRICFSDREGVEWASRNDHIAVGSGTPIFRINTICGGMIFLTRHRQVCILDTLTVGIHTRMLTFNSIQVLALVELVISVRVLLTVLLLVRALILACILVFVIVVVLVAWPDLAWQSLA